MGRKGVSITFYESELEDMPKLKEVEAKYNMPITPLSMKDVETFEKTVKDALKWTVCFTLKRWFAPSSGLLNAQSVLSCLSPLGKLQSASLLHVGIAMCFPNDADAAYQGYKNYTGQKSQNHDSDSTDSVGVRKGRIRAQEDENDDRRATKKELPLLDSTISIESITKEDSLYNDFRHQQLRAMYSLLFC